jgi:protein-tyrosine phosphatase
MPSILFICNANLFRSPLAAALFRKRLQELGTARAWQVGSAGMWAAPGHPALPQAAAAARQFGLDLSGHRSARVSTDLVLDYDLIVVMEAGQREALVNEDPRLLPRVYLLSDVVERSSYDIPDTFGSERDVREVIAELDALIRGGMASICALAARLSEGRST